MLSSTDIAALAAYGGAYDKQLIMQLLLGLTVAQDVTLLPNVKNKLNLTKLTIGNVMKPYNPTFSPNNNTIGFSGRQISVQLGKGEWLIEPEQFRQTYLAEMMKPGVAKADLSSIPFAQYVWAQAMAGAATELDMNTVYSGVLNPAGSTAADIADGFGTILAREITALKVTPFVTGSLATDTVTKVEGLYKSLAKKYRRMPMIAYCSYTTKDRYDEDYATRFDRQPIYDGFRQTTIRQSDGMCKLLPVLWMGDSERIIITPKANMLMAVDSLSDLNTINAIPDVWTVKAGLGVALGFNLRDLEPLAVNDRA